MHISKIQIRNYKSFPSSDEMQFVPGFNVIVGRNNVGKSALVEALSLQFEDRPHRSLASLPTPMSATSSASEVHISFSLGGPEIRELILDRYESFYVSIRDIEPLVTTRATSAQRFLTILEEDSIELACVFNTKGFSSAYFTSYSDDQNAPLESSVGALHFKVDRSLGTITLDKGRASASGRELIGMRIASAIRSGIYMFNAQRLNVGASRFGRNAFLQGDARNLAEVLNLLQSNPGRFAKFNEYVMRIFPEIHHVSVRPSQTDNDVVEIRLWSLDPITERDDLTFALSESGTGIGQVLAILYVVLTSDFPRTIIIDEPQSFLHPGAVRKLIEILRSYPMHQFIITTHSPTVVTSAYPQVILLVSKEGSESTTKSIDPNETQELGLLLSEVGARLSDVFGADSILWVEGPTEELCFPGILAKLSSTALLGTVILGVKQTGDFMGKHSKLVFDIYRRLTEGRGWLPPAIGFIFDQEGRSDRENEDLRREGKGKIFFLPRRMYENYLLNPSAISAIISTQENFRAEPVTAEEVENWLEQHRWDRKYFDSVPDAIDRTHDLWLKSVHSAKVLEDIFTELSETRCTYNKKEHGVLLTNWLLENAKEDLADIAQLIEGILAKQAISDNAS